MSVTLASAGTQGATASSNAFWVSNPMAPAVVSTRHASGNARFPYRSASISTWWRSETLEALCGFRSGRQDRSDQGAQKGSATALGIVDELKEGEILLSISFRAIHQIARYSCIYLKNYRVKLKVFREIGTGRTISVTTFDSLSNRSVNL